MTPSRLAAVIDALPLRPGIRVVEIGCGPGAAAREVAYRLGADGHVLAVDRSRRAIRQLERTAADLIATGRLSARCCDAEHLELEPDEAPYDLAFATRVGALDGRHPAAGELVLRALARVLTPAAVLLTDGGDPLRGRAVPRS